MKLPFILAGAAVTGLVASAPAHSFYLTQTVGPVSFSHSGGSTPPTTSPTLAFPGFSASLPSNLTGVKIILSSTKFSGDFNIANFTASPSVVIASAKPTFNFSPIPATPLTGVTGSSSMVTVAPASVNGGFFGQVAASGAYSGSFTPITTNTVDLQNYFATNPVINNYYVAYDFGPTGVIAGGATPSTNFMGNMYLEYQYVPGPLPLLGAGAAFGWSRRLRKRIARRA